MPYSQATTSESWQFQGLIAGKGDVSNQRFEILARVVVVVER
jgi:hypothetical protein